MICSECKYGKKKRCDVGTEEAVRDVVTKNNELLYSISTASNPRFEDEENLVQNFKDALNSFFDVMSVLYSIPMNGYFPEESASEEKIEDYMMYRRYRYIGYERCIQQVQMRILTLGRASCGFVGEFSSGKTSYLNAEVFGGDVLPVGVRSTTSIPTYIFPGRNDRIILENMRGNIIKLSGFEVLKQLAHSAKPEGCPCRFQWDAVIKRLFCFSSELKYNSDHVYVDLPGYSASADDNRSMKEAIAGCDKILYFKPVDSGQLNEKDIEYLKGVEEKDILIVLSKADTRSPDDCTEVLDLVKATLEEKGINVQNVCLYTNRAEVFVAYKDFSIKLRDDREKIHKFISDTSSKEKDMALSHAMMGYYLDGFMNCENKMSSRLDMIGEEYDKFIGKRKLDEAFFKTWKNINKDIADSSGRYVDTHFFSENTVRINDYLNTNRNRAYNYYIAEAYDSSFNLSYQDALYGYTLYYLYITALTTGLSKESSSYYTDACKTIDSIEKKYKSMREYIDTIISVTKSFFEAHKIQTASIIGDAQLAFRHVQDAYEKLLNYVKDYEKRW